MSHYLFISFILLSFTFINVTLVSADEIDSKEDSKYYRVVIDSNKDKEENVEEIEKKEEEKEDKNIKQDTPKHNKYYRVIEKDTK